MLTLKGPQFSTEFPLPLPTVELQARLDALYERGRLSELVDPYAYLLSYTDWPIPSAVDRPRPRLNSVFWPIVGLAQYAFGVVLVDEYVLGQMQAQMIGASSNVLTLNFYDDPAGSVLETARSVPMHMLATRPLVRTTSSALLSVDDPTAAVDAWIMLLVDDRYKLLHKTANSIVTPASWSALFSACGVSITDAVDSDYLTPEASRWRARRTAGRSIAWLADIAAASVGSRIVCLPGATPTLQRPTMTNSGALATAHAAYIADGRFIGGGTFVNADLEPGYPDSALVTFGGPEETVTPVTVTVTGTGYGWPSGTTVNHYADNASSIGSSLRSAWAAQWAQDWEAWQRNVIDATYAGIVAPVASGFLWAVQWYHDAGTAYTKFMRPPHWYGFLDPPRVSDFFGGLNVEDTTGTPFYSSIFTLAFSQQDGFILSNPSAGVAQINLTQSKWKKPVKCKSTTTLSATYNNGPNNDGVGATLTFGSAVTSLDGITITTGDRVLLTDQTTKLQNGIYVITTATVWTRATDCDTSDKFPSATVKVEQGTTTKPPNHESEWECINDTGAFTVGTTDCNWWTISPLRVSTLSADMPDDNFRPITNLLFDDASGFVVTQPESWTALVSLGFLNITGGTPNFLTLDLTTSPPASAPLTVAIQSPTPTVGQAACVDSLFYLFHGPGSRDPYLLATQCSVIGQLTSGHPSASYQVISTATAVNTVSSAFQFDASQIFGGNTSYGPITFDLVGPTGNGGVGGAIFKADYPPGSTSAGFGAGIDFNAKTTTTMRASGSLYTTWTTATDGSQSAQTTLKTAQAGSLATAAVLSATTAQFPALKNNTNAIVFTNHDNTTGTLQVATDASFFYDPDGTVGPTATPTSLYVGGGASSQDGYLYLYDGVLAQWLYLFADTGTIFCNATLETAGITTNSFFVTGSGSATAGTSSTVPWAVYGLLGQSVDLNQWVNSSAVVLSRVNKDGFFITHKTSAPAGADLNNSEIAWFMDDTAGAAKVKWFTKSSSGATLTHTFSGTTSGTNSGTNTGDQTITLTGDITGSGTGSFATTIANNAVTTAKINNAAVTLAKIQNASLASKLLGSGASGAGSSYTEITIGTGLTMTGTTLSNTCPCTEGTVTAVGSTQGTATNVSASNTNVTGADGTKGVILTDTSAATYTVYNNSTSVLYVYPPSGATINALSANTPVVINGKTSVIVSRVASGVWTVDGQVGGQSGNTYTGSGTFTPTVSGNYLVECWGGGGGGGDLVGTGGQGGGGGEYRASVLYLTGGTGYSYSQGAGGMAGSGGTDGGQSSFGGSTVVANGGTRGGGGGAGGTGGTGTTGFNGGSGGIAGSNTGGGGGSSAGTSAVGGNGVSGAAGGAGGTAPANGGAGGAGGAPVNFGSPGVAPGGGGGGGCGTMTNLNGGAGAAGKIRITGPI